MYPAGCVERCPGCRYRGLSPEQSDRKKWEWSRQCLEPLGIHPLPLLAPTSRWGYRRKSVLHARPGKNGWDLGLIRRRSREEELVPIPECPLHHPALNERLSVLKEHLPAEMPLAFVHATGACFTLVLKSRPDRQWIEWARSKEAALKSAGIEGLQMNWHPSAGRRVLSTRHQEIVFGPAFFHDGERFHGALSFRQQIPELEGSSLSLAETFLAEATPEMMVDLYCGSGATLALWQTRKWPSVGVELVGEACLAAEKNAPGIPVLKGKVEQRLPQLTECVRGKRFVVYTNPPRDGHDKSVLHWLQKHKPQRIAYLSCNQKTLARDLEVLQIGYETKSVQPFDFFPQTDHVESLALLARKP
ncbi:MAG TPA: hypothetical protein VIH99_10785 [Bdellovibrionota bacterium]|jgi:tRNA/tmRNA/rRNA uracil-C5-methylase (TrmA/RlmC/RlmD family)